MAVLQKLRGWGIILSILVALPLLLFIIDPSQVITALQSMSSKFDVGEIAGKSISYENFSKEVDKMAHLSEMMSGSSSSSEQQQKQIRDAVWQSMLDKHLFIPAAQNAGINVGKDEMLDLLYGDNVSPVIANSPVFMDENGTFSRDAVIDFVRNVESDETGNLKAYWDYIQNAVYTNQYYTKYNNLFVASDTDNALVTARKIDDNNVLTDVDFVMVPFSFAKDSTVVVDSKEIVEYYKAHKKNYRQVASRDIEYVVYQVVPSKEDKEAAAEEFASLQEEFATTANIKAFLQKNSDRNYTDYFYKDGELASVNADVDAFVSSHNSGTSPVIEDGDETVVKLSAFPKITVNIIKLSGLFGFDFAKRVFNIAVKREIGQNAIFAKSRRSRSVAGRSRRDLMRTVRISVFDRIDGAFDGGYALEKAGRNARSPGLGLFVGQTKRVKRDGSSVANAHFANRSFGDAGSGGGKHDFLFSVGPTSVAPLKTAVVGGNDKESRIKHALFFTSFVNSLNVTVGGIDLLEVSFGSVTDRVTGAVAIVELDKQQGRNIIFEVIAHKIGYRVVAFSSPFINSRIALGSFSRTTRKTDGNRLSSGYGVALTIPFVSP